MSFSNIRYISDDKNVLKTPGQAQPQHSQPPYEVLLLISHSSIVYVFQYPMAYAQPLYHEEVMIYLQKRTVRSAANLKGLK